MLGSWFSWFGVVFAELAESRVWGLRGVGDLWIEGVIFGFGVWRLGYL